MARHMILVLLRRMVVGSRPRLTLVVRCPLRWLLHPTRPAVVASPTRHSRQLPVIVMLAVRCPIRWLTYPVVMLWILRGLLLLALVVLCPARWPLYP